MLLDVVKAVARSFEEYGCPAPVLHGNEHIAEHAEPPRVVFIPSKSPEKFLPPLAIQAPGPLPQTSAWVENKGGSNPRQIARRLVTAEIHIWGGAPRQPDPKDQEDADQNALDALINQTVLSIHLVAPGNDRSIQGRQLPNPNHVKRGLVYILDAVFEMPVIQVMFPPAVLDECRRTYPMAHADGEVTVEEIDGEGAVQESATFVPGDPEVAA